MNFTNSGKNTMLAALSGAITGALYTGADFDNDEVTGGGYSRQSITYDAAVAGNRNASALPEFDVPAGTTITHFALWMGGNRIAEGPLPANESYTKVGKYQLTDSDLTLNNPT